MLEAIAGHDPNDPTSLPGEAPTLTQSLNGGIRGIRIGWDERFSGAGVDPELFESLNVAVHQIIELGGTKVDVRVPNLGQYGKAWITLCAAEAYVAHSKYFPSRRDEYGPWLRKWLEMGQEVTGPEYVAALYQRDTCVGQLNKLFADIDVLVCPSQATPPFPVTREMQYGPIPESFLENFEYARFTGVFDFSGAPTLSLPCGFNRENLPLSLQIVGKHGREDILCRIGHAYEQATDFHTRHPNVG